MSVTAISAAVGSLHVARSRAPRPRMAVRSGGVSVGPMLTRLRSDCATPLPVLRHVADAMAADMRAGLAADGGSDLQMILSYVDALPTGYDVVSRFLFVCLTFFFSFLTTRFFLHYEKVSCLMDFMII